MKTNANLYALYVSATAPTDRWDTSEYSLLSFATQESVNAGINTEDDSTKADGNWSRDFVTHRNPTIPFSGILIADSDTAQNVIEDAALDGDSFYFLLTANSAGYPQYAGACILNSSSRDLALRGRGVMQGTLHVQGALYYQAAQDILVAWAPSLDGLVPAAGGTATFTRSTTATYFDSNGVLQTASTNTPRYQDDGFLLLEGASTNMIANSNTTTGWNLSNCTAASSSVNGPDGTTAMTRITLGSFTTDFAVARKLTASNVTSGNSVAGSCVVDTDTATHRYWRFTLSSVFAGTAYILLDLANPTTPLVTGAAVSKYQVERIGTTTQYRVTVVAPATSTGAAYFGAHAYSAADSTFTSAGTEVLDIGDLQVEQLGYSTSIIQTSGSAVTRNADILTAPFTTAFPSDGLTILWAEDTDSTNGTGTRGVGIGSSGGVGIGDFALHRFAEQGAVLRANLGVQTNSVGTTQTSEIILQVPANGSGTIIDEDGTETSITLADTWTGLTANDNQLVAVLAAGTQGLKELIVCSGQQTAATMRNLRRTT